MMFLVAGSCEDDPAQPQVGTGTFRIVLDQTVDGEPLVQGTGSYTTAEGNDYSVNKLLYVLSLMEVASEDAHGRRRHVEGPEVHLRDAFNPDSRVVEIEGAPEGDYTGLSFVFGLNEEMNDPSNTYTQPGLDKEWTDMGWNPLWGGGYHYMKLEGRVIPEVEPRGATAGDGPLATHLGRFLDDTKTAFPHFFPVDLEFEQPVSLGDGDVYEIQVVMDIDKWYQMPNLIDLDVDSLTFAIMTRTEVQDMYEANGSDATGGVFSLGTVAEVD